MNKKGFTFFYALMIGVVFFLLGMALTPALSQFIDYSTNTLEFNCSNETLSQQNKAVCTQIDYMQFLFTGLMFGLAGFIIGGKAL